jgi:hypothetical protein
MFSMDLKAFFEEQKGGIRVGQVEAGAGVLPGTDGYVCLEAGQTGFFIPLDNPQGYTLAIESSFTQTEVLSAMDVTVSQEGKGRLAVNIPAGQTAGNEGILHLKLATAKEGRILYEGNLGIAYFNLADFSANISGLTIVPGPSLTLTPPFAPATEEQVYSIAENVPSSFTLTVTTADPDNTGAHAPLVFIDGEPCGSGTAKTIVPVQLISTVTVRVELPHGAASRTYSVTATRTGAGASLDVLHAPNKTVYQAGDTLDRTGLEVRYASASGESKMVSGDCKTIYSFTEPGPTFVLVTYIDDTGTPLKTTFDAWVVGLGSLTVTGPDDYAPAFGLDDFSFIAYDPITHTSVYDLDLGAVPSAVDKLYITAANAVAGASLTITPPPVGNPQAVSLNPGPNTITITVRLDKRDGNLSSPNIEARTYTLTVYRTPELYVSPTGNNGNSGTQGLPLLTVAEALARAKSYGAVPGAEFAIIISGNVTADTGTTNGMVDISGSGYPRIILKGASGGGTIDASGTKRVLYIGSGNTVCLGDSLTLTGGSAISGGGVSVYGGTFTMSGTATIRGNNAPSGSGGGVFVSSGGTFTMSGGYIQNNSASGSGGGIVVTGSGTTFTMNGGIIQSNTSSSSYGGGVYVSSGGTFTISDGVIQNNAASYSGGGVYAGGSGTTFTKTGGTIAGSDAVSPLQPNTASSGGRAVYLSGGNACNLTVGPDVTLYAAYNSSVWSYVDPLPIADGGAGDTTGNWQ